MDEVLARIIEAIGDHPVGLVISDMAPNMSGVQLADRVRAMYLCELVLGVAGWALRLGDDFLIEIFLGEGFAACRKQVRAMFDKV